MEGNISTSSPFPANLSIVSEDVMADIAKYKTIARGIIKYGFPSVMLPGVVGNLLCIITLQAKQFADNNTALLLTVLAVVDIIALCVQGLHSWLNSMAIIHLTTENNGLCKVWGYMYYVFIHLSAWMLVLITMERFVIVQWPHRHNILCGRKVIVISAFLMCLVLLLLNLYLPITSEIFIVNETNSSTWSYCDMDLPPDKYWMYDFRSWSDMVISCLLPFVVILVGNVIIVVKLTLHTKRKTKLKLPKNNASKSVTIMLVLASFTFLLTSLPINIIILAYDLLFPDWETDDLMYAWSDIFFCVASILTFANHAVNFVLYFISGPTFRHAFYRVFGLPKLLKNFRMSGSETRETNTPAVPIKSEAKF